MDFNEAKMEKLVRLLGEHRKDQIEIALGVGDSPMKRLHTSLTDCTSYEGCLLIADESFPGSDIKFIALEKALWYATSYEQCMDVVNRSPSHSDIMRWALKKAFEMASNFDQCMKVVSKLSLDSEVRRGALRRALELASSYEQYLFIAENSIHDSKIERKALDKALRIKFQEAQTIEDYTIILQRARIHSSLCYEIIRKIADLLQ